LYKETTRTFSEDTQFYAKNALSNATKGLTRGFSDGSLNSLVDVPVCKETISTENIDLNNLCQSQDVVQTEEITSYSYMNSIDFPQNKQNEQFEACQEGGVPFPETEVNLVLYPQATQPTVLHSVNFFWRDAK
jgi:cbb3-type cytochrome oxidase cytochrome c subunit